MAGQMQVKPNDFSCCVFWDFVGPGACKGVARLDGNKGVKMHLVTLYFLSFCFSFQILLLRVLFFTTDYPTIFHFPFS